MDWINTHLWVLVLIGSLLVIVEIEAFVYLDSKHGFERMRKLRYFYLFALPMFVMLFWFTLWSFPNTPPVIPKAKMPTPVYRLTIEAPKV